MDIFYLRLNGTMVKCDMCKIEKQRQLYLCKKCLRKYEIVEINDYQIIVDRIVEVIKWEK